LVADAGDLTELGGSLSIGPCSPNPLRESTSIFFEIPRGSATGIVRLSIYDVTGRRVRELTPAVSGPGRYEATWDARDDAGTPVMAGAYFCRIQQGDRSRTTRVVVLR
jgi:flagellar hook assembly protein FlgD